MLENYTDKELREELARRKKARAQERDQRPVCKNCAYWDTIDVWGEPKGKDESMKSTAYCPFHRNLNGLYRIVSIHHKGCGKFISIK